MRGENAQAEAGRSPAGGSSPHAWGKLCYALIKGDIDMTYDMNRRANSREINSLFLANFSTGDPQQVLATVKAPALVLWGLENRTVMHLEADVFAYWLSSAPVALRKYPGLGHYAYIEEPAVIARDVADFLSGYLDSELRAPCLSD